MHIFPHHDSKLLLAGHLGEKLRPQCFFHLRSSESCARLLFLSVLMAPRSRQWLPLLRTKGQMKRSLMEWGVVTLLGPCAHLFLSGRLNHWGAESLTRGRAVGGCACWWVEVGVFYGVQHPPITPQASLNHRTCYANALLYYRAFDVKTHTFFF